jgi:hypothetical protein
LKGRELALHAIALALPAPRAVQLADYDAANPEHSAPDEKDESPLNQEALWSKRYQDAGEQYLFGTEPNRVLAHRAGLLQEGRTALSKISTPANCC